MVTYARRSNATDPTGRDNPPLGSDWVARGVYGLPVGDTQPVKVNGHNRVARSSTPPWCQRLARGLGKTEAEVQLFPGAPAAVVFNGSTRTS